MLAFKRCELSHFIHNLFETIKMIFGKPACNDSDNESTVVAYSNTFLFRRVDISGTDNQCIMNSLNAFYKDVDDSRKANILWNVVN